MPLVLPDDYWIEIPASRYTVGLTRDDARMLAVQSAAWSDHHGPEWSINDAKLVDRALALQSTWANAEWVEAYLLDHFPAREVEIPAFAIARYPITSGQYRQFMTDTGESEEPNSWEVDDEFRDDHRPVRGVAWAAALALSEWAGARLPFEDEWERAIRGAQRFLFPWGNEFGAIGFDVMDEQKRAATWRVDMTTSPEGVQGALIGMHEWCADWWEQRTRLAPGTWNESDGPRWCRAVRGGPIRQGIVSAVTRFPNTPTSFENAQAGIRLVRRDERRIPGLHPDTPRDEQRMMQVRAFEVHTLRPTLTSLCQSRMAEANTVDVTPEKHHSARADRGANAVKLAVAHGWTSIRAGYDRAPHSAGADPAAYLHGSFFTAVARESVRRHPQEHGVFVWNIQYRFAEDGKVRARPAVAYHMTFNDRVHVFHHRFRAEETDTATEDLTPELIRDSVMSALQFYELHADGDLSPF